MGLAIILSLMLHDVQYGPQAALIAESFDADIRYTGAGMGYQLASVVAGGPAPLIAAALLAATGDSTSISIYIIICCAISMLALILLPKVASVAVSGTGTRGRPGMSVQGTDVINDAAPWPRHAHCSGRPGSPPPRIPARRWATCWCWTSPASSPARLPP